VYQHEQDKQDGVVTLSYKLGKRGTFVFSMLCSLCNGVYVCGIAAPELFFAFFVVYVSGGPVLFELDAYAVWHNGEAADFKNSLRMNVVSTVCMLLYFSTLIILKYSLSKIVSIGTAVPAHCHPANGYPAVHAMRVLQQRNRQAQAAVFVWHQSGIKQRYSVVPDYSRAMTGSFTRKARTWNRSPAWSNAWLFSTSRRRCFR
jgi:hypothetical protein